MIITIDSCHIRAVIDAIEFANSFLSGNFPMEARASKNLMSSASFLRNLIDKENEESLASLIQSLIVKVDKMTKEVDDLKAAVTTENTVIGSAIVLINGITDRVTAAVNAALAANPGVDLSALNDITTEINTEASALASAVAAQTPAAPAPAPVDPNPPVVTDPNTGTIAG